VYLHRDVELTARLRARAAWLSTGATLCGLSAAAVLGTQWLDAGDRPRSFEQIATPRLGSSFILGI